MPSKPASSKKRAKRKSSKKTTKIPKDLAVKLEGIQRRVEEVRTRLTEDPESMTLSMQLAGLNEVRWNLLGEVAQRGGDLAAAAKAAIQEGRWNHHKVQCAKQRVMDTLRDHRRRREQHSSVRERFRMEAASRETQAGSI
jgi:hypothetical protein